MNKPNENEQWLLDGDCNICRRNNYCKKDCKTGGMYGEMLNKTKY